MHGRQWIKRGDNVFMNVGKVGKLSSMSIRDTFEVCKEDDDDEVYRVQADLMGRTFEFRNGEGELVAIMAKTKKALIQTAVFGSGSESTIDVAPGTSLFTRREQTSGKCSLCVCFLTFIDVCAQVLTAPLSWRPSLA